MRRRMGDGLAKEREREQKAREKRDAAVRTLRQATSRRQAEERRVHEKHLRAIGALVEEVDLPLELDELRSYLVSWQAVARILQQKGYTNDTLHELLGVLLNLPPCVRQSPQGDGAQFPNAPLAGELRSGEHETGKVWRQEHEPVGSTSTLMDADT